MRNLRLACLSLTLLAACTTPYKPPVAVEEPGGQPARAFDGIAASLSSERKTRVFWTHGMCSHDDAWVLATNQAFAAALNAAIPPRLAAKSSDDDELVRRFNFVTPRGELEVAYFVWSSLTRQQKETLQFDSSSPFKRATLNGDLKVGLINDCFADAILYASSQGDAVRHAAVRAVCTALGGRRGATGVCELAPGAASEPVIFVTESLGSKVVMDALGTIWNEHRSRGAGPAFRRRAAAVRTVFMLANQLPLMNLAAPGASLRDVLATLGELPGGEARTLVAFSDPNDLLSYRLHAADVGVPGTRLLNIAVSNDPTYFGYVERPDNAHCGYNWNPHVLGMLLLGYDPARPLHSIASPAKQSCLK